MVRNRRRSTALKMALAGMCTVLCIEGMLQRGLSVPVCAEDTDEQNYVGSSEWEEFIDYWHSSMNVAVDDLTGSAFDADDVARLNTATYAYASMLYQQYAQQLSTDPNTGAIDYSVDIPAGQIICGWYYRANKPHAITLFGYNQSGDWTELKSNNIVVMSSDEFTCSVNVTLDSSQVYHGIKSETYSGGYANNFRYSIYNASMISFTGSNFIDTFTYNAYEKKFECKSNSNTICTLDSVSYNANGFIGYYSSYSYTYAYSPLINYCGCLKDSNNQPISSVYQKFVRAQVGNNFPDFLLGLKQDLDDNFPAEIVDELWYDPTQGEPLPDVGTLDSLTFPPGLPSVEFNDVELPSEPLPAKALQGAGFWFSSFSNMLDALGVKYIVITFLIIALIMAILKI